MALSSCSSLLVSIYGIKSTQDKYSKEDIQKIALSYGIKSDESFFLQNSYIDYFDSIGLIYGHNWRTCDTSQISRQFKNHFQPLQILFFNKSGKLVSFQNNCYYGGFPNFKWNRNHALDYIPAKGVVPLDSLITYDELIHFVTNIEDRHPYSITLINQEYSVVVFWTTFMGRQSKRLIHTINKKYIQKNDLNISALYINADCCSFQLY